MLDRIKEEFNNQFKNVGWHPENKARILSFIQKAIEQAVIEGRIEENKRLYFDAYEFRNISQDLMSTYQGLRDKELKEKLKETT